MTTDSKSIEMSNGFIGRRAVIIGGSMGGLLASRALSDYFEEVAIIEKDVLDDTSLETRKSVPQGKHTHAFMQGGANLLKEFFPDLDLTLEAGTFPTDGAGELQWYQHGRWKVRFSSGINLYFCNRMKLEQTIRKQVRKIPNVHFLCGQKFSRFLTNGEASHIQGVEIEDIGRSNGKESIMADLVIDASGRGSKSPKMLEQMGYPRVTETSFKIDVAYASRLYRMPPGFLEKEKAFAIHPMAPYTKRLGVLYPFGDDSLMLTLGGWGGDHPSTEEDEFLEYARSLPTPDIYNCIKDLEPLTPITPYKFPSNLWRRYEKLSSWPGNFAIIGDAVCSFNPIYGQGMTATIFDAWNLRKILQSVRSGRHELDSPKLFRRFQKLVAKVIWTPWLLAAIEDFRFNETEGERPPGLTFLLWYVEQLYKLSGTNPEVHRRVIEVLCFLKGPIALLHPVVVTHVLKQSVSDVLPLGTPNEPHQEGVTG